MEQLVSDAAILAAGGFISGAIAGKVLKKAVKAAVTIGSVIFVAVVGANYLGLMNTDWAVLQAELMRAGSTPEIPSVVMEVLTIAPVGIGFAVGAVITFVHS